MARCRPGPTAGASELRLASFQLTLIPFHCFSLSYMTLNARLTVLRTQRVLSSSVCVTIALERVSTSSYGCPVLFLPTLPIYLILLAFGCVSSTFTVEATRTWLVTYPNVCRIINLFACAASFLLVRIFCVIGAAFRTPSNIAISPFPSSFSTACNVTQPFLNSSSTFPVPALRVTRTLPKPAPRLHGPPLYRWIVLSSIELVQTSSSLRLHAAKIEGSGWLWLNK